MRMSPDDLIKLYDEAKSARSPHESDWRLASAHCMPSDYNMWNSQGPANPSAPTAARRIAYDTTGLRSLPKYISVLTRMATPMSQRWHGLASDNEYLNKVPAVRAYYQQVTETLFKMRYRPRSNFEVAQSEVYASLGVYGTAPKFIGASRVTPLSPKPGILYKACPLRDTFLLVDDDGSVSMLFRRFWLNARQFREKWPDQTPPPSVAAEMAKPLPAEGTYFEFFHVVYIKQMDDYDPEAYDNRRFPVGSSYVCVPDKMFSGEEGGYMSWPYPVTRTFTMSGTAYGFSPAQRALPALGTASATKKSYLKQAQRATDQVLLAHDDGVMNGRIDLNPGRVNYGAVDAQGRRLVHALEAGNFQVAEAILQDERRDIEDSFFVTLFQILQETPEMTATEVVERATEKASLLAPTMGRIQSEDLGPTVGREIDLASEFGMLPEMPPELVEAEGEYRITYTSPLAKGQYSEEVGGFLRSLEIAANAAASTQDPSHLDHFNLDVAIPEIAGHMATPDRWLTSDAQKKAVREARAAQQQQQQLVDAAPAAAGVIKAASTAKGA